MKAARGKKSDQPKKLTPRQERFVAEYLIDLNATQAAIRAGYSAKDADVQGPRLLGNVGVAKSIAEAKAKRLASVEITQARVLEELSLLAFSDHTHYEVDDKGQIQLAAHAPAGAHRALASVKRTIRSWGGGSENSDEGGDTIAEVELRLWDKPRMLKLAGRHVGLFPDRIEVSGPNGGPIQTEAVLTSAERRKRLREITERARAKK